MTNLSTNSTEVSPADRQFRNQAIDFIERVLKSRIFCHQHKKGRMVTETTIKPVKAHFEAYRRSWTPRGVATFITRYQNNLLDMTTCAAHIDELVGLVHESKKYLK